MAIIGGEWKDVSVNHPTLGSKTFFLKQGANGTLITGGVRNDDDVEVTSAGEGVYKKRTMPWEYKAEIAVDSVIKEEHKFLSEMAESTEEGTWTFAHISGVVYSGVGMPMGNMEADYTEASMELKVSGGGKCSRIV